MPNRHPIGLVGCGNWGRHILRDLVSLGCEVSVVARSSESRARASEGGARAIVTNLSDLPEVDGIVVATPTTTHAAIAEESLARGVPVFVEKPLTPDPATAARLAAAAPDRLFVMDKWRYHPGIEMLATIARSSELGPVQGLRTTRVGWGNPHGDVDAVWHLTPHDLSIALEIIGHLPEATYARADRTSEGPVGLIAGLGDDPWVVIEVSGRSHENRREIRLHCRDAVAVLADSYSEHIEVVRGSHAALPEVELRPIATDMPLFNELQVFIEHLEGGPPPRSSAREGAEIVQRLADLRALAGLEA